MPLYIKKSVLFNTCLLSKQKIKLPLFFFSINNKVSFSFIVPSNWTVGLSVFFLIIQARINFTKLFFQPTNKLVNTDFRFYTFVLNLNKTKNFLFFFLFFRFFFKAARQFSYEVYNKNCVYSFNRFQSYNVTDSCSSSIALNEVFWHGNVRFFYTNKFCFLLFLDFFKLK